MADLQALGAVSIAIQQVHDDPQLMVETESDLDKLIASDGRAEMVSALNYRLTFQTNIPGGLSAVNLDNAAVNFPNPTSSAWQSGTLAPVSYALGVGWTKLAELTGKSPLTVVDIVAKEMADSILRMAQIRDMMICAGDGTGFLGNVIAVDSGNNILTFNNNDYGARLLVVGQPIDLYNGNTLVGTCTVQAVNDPLGGAQTVSVDAVPGGAASGNIARVNGLVSGAPVFTYGIPYWLSNSGVGLTVGLDRSQPANNFIISNGLNAANSSITPALLKLPYDQIKQKLGKKAVSSGKFKVLMHTAQRASYDNLAGQSVVIQTNNGNLSNYDMVFSGSASVGGNPIVESIHAHIQEIAYLNLERWGKIKWGNPPFWFTSEGRKVFQQVGTNGQITSGAASYFIDTTNFYVDSPKAQSLLYNCRQPAGY